MLKANLYVCCVPAAAALKGCSGVARPVALPALKAGESTPEAAL
jgi:hypothetical protein